MVGLLISLLVLALVVWLVLYIIDMLPLPEPPKMIAKVIVGVVALIFVLGQFLPIVGGAKLALY